MKGLVKVSRAKAAPAKAKTRLGTRTVKAKITARKAAPARKPRAKTVKAKTNGLKKPAARKSAPVSKPIAKKPAAMKSTLATTAARRNLAKPVPAQARTLLPRPATELPPKETKPTSEQIAREKELARERAASAMNRALDLLEALARTGPVPLAVLADTAGCGKAAAVEVLNIMQTRNFVIQDEAHGLWRLGARWAVLGSAASEQGALAATAMPHLAALGNATGENVYLRVREGMECETIAIYQTDPGLRVYTAVGTKMPLHAGSGRVLLAHSPEAVQTQVLAQRLQRYTPSTRTDPTWIAADLQRIRQRGFLITESEVVAGTVSVCSPVRDASGQVIAALLIGSPSLRMRPPRPRALMPAVVEAARKLSHALGSIPEKPAPAQPNGQAEARYQGEATRPAWPATALGATISRPHSIFR
jgi:IclR family KDG regulon transcriptional repressor